MSEYTDFLLVGGGIAGVCLQLELTSRGYNCSMYNEDDRNVSTVIAAGIVNPIAGKYFSLTWRADDFFPELQRYYQDLEARFGARFFYSKPIRRVLTTAGEQNTWLSKAHLKKYEGYCSYQSKGAAFGSIEIEHGGHLDTKSFLTSARNYLKKHSRWNNERFDYAQLDEVGKKYKGQAFKQLIFCEGFDLVNNPYFSKLPFTPNKGELLEIYAPKLNEDVILTGGVFVLPVGDHRFKVGASYEHHNLNLLPTEKNKRTICEKLEKVIDCDYEVVNHFVGLRPAVKDRRPLLGSHSDYPGLHIFNGLGSKGVSMAPRLASEMADYLLDQTPLHHECSIERL